MSANTESETAAGLNGEVDDNGYARGRNLAMFDDASEPAVTQQTLAAWRAELARIRLGERQRQAELSAETGRLLEIVGQALAQGGGALPSADVARIEELTQVTATYR